MLRTAVPYPALKTNPVPIALFFFALCSEPAHSALSNDAAPACMAQDSAVTGTAAVHTLHSLYCYTCVVTLCNSSLLALVLRIRNTRHLGTKWAAAAMTMCFFSHEN